MNDKRLIEDYLLIESISEKFNHAKKEIVAARFFEIPAEAIDA